MGLVATANPPCAPEITSSVKAPPPTRTNVTIPGAKASSPMAMKRKDAPQIRETPLNNPQSAGVNWPVFWAAVAVKTLGFVVGHVVNVSSVPLATLAVFGHLA